VPKWDHSGGVYVFQYDGFGNLAAKVLNGTTNAIAVNGATNQLSSAYYDANGNMTSGAGATIIYDEANRMKSAQEAGGGIEYYGYAPDNKRIYRKLTNGTEEWTFYGAKGEKLGVYWLAPYNGTWQFYGIRLNVWFAGKLISEAGQGVFQDRLGTNRAWTAGTPPARFLPYGEELTSPLTTNDRTKFATYNRDSYTGLDYADQRFYASTYGRFNTPDPFKPSADVRDPSRSWNRYAYTLGDPINGSDPTGLLDCNDLGVCDEGGGFDLSDWEYIGTGVANDPSTHDSIITDECLASVICGTGASSGIEEVTNSPAGQVVQQVGQNMQGFNGLLGTVAGGSLLGGGLLAALPTAAAAPGLAAAIAEPVPVIGSLSNTMPLIGNTMYNVFNPQVWTVAANAAWINGIISSGQSVALGTVLSSATTFNGGPYNGGFTMFGEELGWLFNAGYTVVGSYVVPPVP